MNYRNTWVHDKPPIVKGLGMQYNRKSRVTRLDDGTSRIVFGGGSPHLYMINDLIMIVRMATQALANMMDRLMHILIKRREDIGETFDFEKGSTAIKLWSSPRSEEM